MSDRSIANGVQGFGWYSIRVDDLTRAHEFYSAIGFGEVLGRTDRYGHFEVGEGTWLNIGKRAAGDAPVSRAEHPSQVGTLPVFAFPSSDAVAERAEALTGRPAVVLDTPFGSTRCLADPEGNFIGVVDAPEGTDEGQGLPKLIGVRRQSLDLKLSQAFYAALGLSVWTTSDDAAVADVGNGASLALTAAKQGIVAPPQLTSRTSSPMCPILRVYGIDLFEQRARAIDAGLLERVKINGGDLVYVTDPDGQLIGFQERGEDSVRPVDHRMRERWLLHGY